MPGRLSRRGQLNEHTHRHRYRFIDFRYPVRLGEADRWACSLCVIEGYSRKILAAMEIPCSVVNRPGRGYSLTFRGDL